MVYTSLRTRFTKLKKMKSGDGRAVKVYETIGVYLGYTVAHYAAMYDIKNLLVLGRVTSGDGGELIISKALEVLKDEFPELVKGLSLRTASERDKRCGQAVAAASLPSLD